MHGTNPYYIGDFVSILDGAHNGELGRIAEYSGGDTYKVVIAPLMLLYYINELKLPHVMLNWSVLRYYKPRKDHYHFEEALEIYKRIRINSTSKLINTMQITRHLTLKDL